MNVFAFEALEVMRLIIYHRAAFTVFFFVGFSSLKECLPDIVVLPCRCRACALAVGDHVAVPRRQSNIIIVIERNGGVNSILVTQMLVPLSLKHGAWNIA